MTGHWRKRFLTGTIAMSLFAAGLAPTTEVYADAAPDGKTEAAVLAETLELGAQWAQWKID